MGGILGKKIGMTQIFNAKGERVTVTAVEAGPCPILAVKDKSLQVAFEKSKESKVTKPLLGVFKKAGVAAHKYVREIPRDAGAEFKAGEEVKADYFKEGDFVDVTGVSIGKGFQGGMKRWHWKGGPMTHGSTSRRRVGSIGSTTTPGRVIRGHHMPGHMGHARVTVQNLKVAAVDAESNIILINGAVPGPKNSLVLIRSAKKKAKKS
ncbi:MAG: 50S ribosomal protein L3 [Candidatus Omnitrophota bacterium]|jgi:large subunit ribosomal protein L3